jgi:hypothetical protein
MQKNKGDDMSIYELEKMTNEQLKEKRDVLYKKNAELRDKIFENDKQIEDIEYVLCERRKAKEFAERGANYYDCTDDLGRTPCDKHYNNPHYDINGDYTGV